jgi:hypothetical protein
VRVALLVVAGCGGTSVPLAQSVDGDTCVRAHHADEPAVTSFAGGRALMCWGGGSCVTLDVATGTFEGGVDNGDREPAPLPRFEMASDETALQLCERGAACISIRVPGRDPRTVPAVASADGSRVFAVMALGDRVFVDTYDRRSRRVGRVRLTGDDSHGHSIERVGTAVLVSDELYAEKPGAVAYTLVDPFTGAIRELAKGSALELDEHTALVVEGRSAAIVDTRTLRTLATHVAPGAPVTDHSSASGSSSGPFAVVAFTAPPTVVAIDVRARRFGASWRIPVCKPPPPRPKAPPVIDDEPVPSSMR